MKRLPLSILLLTLSPLPASASCPSWDTGCINRENSYRYQQQSQEWAYREQQKLQQWQQENQIRHLQNDLNRMGSYRPYGGSIGSPYRPF